MKDLLEEALLAWYDKYLKPEFDKINAGLARHDQMFEQVFALCEKHGRSRLPERKL